MGDNPIITDEHAKNLKSITTLMSKFTYVGQSKPFNDEEIKPIPFSGIISGWYKYHDLYIAKTTIYQPSYAFCSVHKYWISIPRFQSYYVTRHMLTHSDFASQFRQRKDSAISNVLTQTPAALFDQNHLKIIRRQLYSYILTHDRPISDADSAQLKALCPIISAKDLRAVASQIADNVRKELKILLENGMFLRPSIDEWQDASMHRYIGETIYFIGEGKWMEVTIALMKINSVHATAQEISNILDLINTRYELDPTQVRYCSDNCNTMLKVQTIQQIERFPCIIHIIHNLAKCFLKKQILFTNKLEEIAGFLHSSSIFAQYCENLHINKIPKFTYVRWCSAFDTIEYILKNKGHIQKFIKTEKISISIDEQFWSRAYDNKTCIGIFRSCILALEGDEFGAISYVPQIFTSLETALQNFPKAEDSAIAVESTLTKLHQFQEDFKHDLYPLIYVAEFLNPSLVLKLNTKQKQKAIKYIIERAKRSGYTIPNHNEITTSHIQNDDEQSVVAFSDSQCVYTDLLEDLQKPENRRLAHEPEALLRYWMTQFDKPETKGIAFVALETLSTLCNSASVEREFSKAKHILTMTRMRLLPEIAEDLLLIRANEQIAKKYLEKI